MERKRYFETLIISSTHLAILEKIGVISREDIDKRFENLAEKLEKSDARRVWTEGKKDCQHKWSVKRKTERVKGEYQKIMEYLICERCHRTIFIDGWINERGGGQIQIEPDGSEGVALLDEGLRPF